MMDGMVNFRSCHFNTLCSIFLGFRQHSSRPLQHSGMPAWPARAPDLTMSQYAITEDPFSPYPTPKRPIFRIAYRDRTWA